MVVHSHDFTLRQQYVRNYIQGYEIARHRELLGNVSASSEGMKMVKTISLKLLKKGKVASFVHFGFDCCARMLGSKVGTLAFKKKKD